jgi:hypothetical protein
MRFMILALAAGLAQAQEPNTLSEQEKKDGWKLLFDGTSLQGWMNWKTKKPLEEGKWKVEGGALVLTGKGAGDIYTAEAFENFELSVEWKTTGNSGILIRVDPEYNGQIWKPAPEVQINRDTPKSLGSSSAGALYALYGVEGGEKVIHPDGWNEIRIRLVDGRGEHWMNGRRLYSYEIGSDDWNKRVAASKFKDEKAFARKSKGHIGLQDHGAVVSFRNVKIRPLPKAE